MTTRPDAVFRDVYVTCWSCGETLLDRDMAVVTDELVRCHPCNGTQAAA